MNKAKVFTNGRSQAVRLPKDFRFEQDEVFIAKVGDMVVLYPRRAGWDLLAKSINRFTDDFMTERDQPLPAERRKKL